MSGAKHPRQEHRNRLLGPAFTTLAFWQLRRTWLLLLFIALGMIAAIIIASAIPLLSNVMMTAGLRNILRATPGSADIQLLTQANGISSPVVHKIHKRIVSGRHWYLWGLGVKPARQGLGIGGMLIQPVLAQADIDRLPCYLETMNEKNVPFYEKYGFRVVNDGVVLRHRLRVWAMLREPC